MINMKKVAEIYTTIFTILGAYLVNATLEPSPIWQNKGVENVEF